MRRIVVCQLREQMEKQCERIEKKRKDVSTRPQSRF